MKREPANPRTREPGRRIHRDAAAFSRLNVSRETFVLIGCLERNCLSPKRRRRKSRICRSSSGGRAGLSFADAAETRRDSRNLSSWVGGSWPGGRITISGEEYEKHDRFEHSEQAQDGRAYPGAASRAFGRVAPDGDEVGDGDSTPDLANAGALAEALDVSLDALVGYDPHGTMLPMPPRGKHLFGHRHGGRALADRHPQAGARAVRASRPAMPCWCWATRSRAWPS